jgi:hypothetical protein
LLNLILKNATDIKPKQAECVSSSEGAENIQPQKKIVKTWIKFIYSSCLSEQEC